MKRKTWVGVVLAATLAVSMLLLGACSQGGSQSPEKIEFGKTNASVEKKTYPYVKDFPTDKAESGDYERSEVNLYYVEGGDIPYVAMTEYMDLLSEALDKRGGRPGIAYTVSKFAENAYQVARTDTESSMLIDTKENTIFFDNFNSFTQLASVTASVTLMDLPEPPAAFASEASQDGWDALSEASDAASSEASAALSEASDAAASDASAAASDASASASSEASAASSDAGGAAEASSAAASDANASASSDASDATEFAANEEGQNPSETLFKTGEESVNLTPRMVTLELSDYLIDIVEHDGECYVPLQTMNDLFMGPLYLQYVFNGEGLYAMRFGEKLIDEAYEVEPREMSEDYALFNYNELRLLLDVHYGLKPEHGIESFGELLGEKTNLAMDFTSTDPAKTDEALKTLTVTYLDDLHSGFTNASPWSPSGGSDNSLAALFGASGFTSNKHFNVGADFTTARSTAFPDGVPMYQEIGDTAFVTFDSFVTKENWADYYHMDDPNPDEFVIPIQNMTDILDAEEITPELLQGPQIDTIRLLVYANRQITREGSPIKNVVLDLSNNGGGTADAAVFTIAWVLGRANVVIRDTFTGAQTLMRIDADLNLDETYDPWSCLTSHGLNVYCLTSINSFSCGNLVPAALKMSEKAIIVGQESGGGSCVVLPCTTASGSLFQISGSRQLSTIRNGSFYNIDQGIEPDVLLTKPESFYDREALADYLKSLK